MDHGLVDQLRGGRPNSRLLIGSLTLVILLIASEINAEGPLSLSSFVPKRSAKELELDLKVALNKLKIRKEPIARMTNEATLSRLLREERHLVEEINALEAEIKNYEPKRSSASGGGRSKQTVRLKFAPLAKKEVEERTAERDRKMKQLIKLRNSIQESKNIIAHPEQYISVPSNYGLQTPEEVQEEVREVMFRDLENMHRREQIREGQIEAPFVLTDTW